MKACLSITLYNTAISDLTRVYDSICISAIEWVLYLIDNSPTSVLGDFADRDPRIKYIHNPSNPGFGAAHNLAIKRAIADGYRYHFVINPDIHFKNDVMMPMINFMEANHNVGMLMPEVLNEDGSVQYLPKLLPNIFWVIRRKLKKLDPWHQSFINRYELREVARDKIYAAPILSGCFTLLNLSAIREIGMYDDQFFMYFEDWDLSRRMNERYKTIYFPKVSVYHGYEGGANKNKRLFKIFLNSAISYFNKWGWIDKRRKMINNKVLNQDLDKYRSDISLN